jgi:16S rRNA (adenine1518-N6/adenine1519-N6)-dimethyltransferase
MRRFEIRPRHELGQNFLIDSNILDVITAAARLEREDVVLEIGGGLGILSEHLAPRVAHLHVVEVDERLSGALGEALAPFSNVSLHWTDAMRLELEALSPSPTKVVANLPYGIAAGVLLRTVEELPGVRTWVALVQREVGERLAAGPGEAPYGASSALLGLSGQVRLRRPIPRTVFSPVPNVDSMLIAIARTAPPAPAAVRALVRASFAHRRKSLARSLALAGPAEQLPALSREQVREALERIGHRPDARAERLSAEDFRALAELLGL